VLVLLEWEGRQFQLVLRRDSDTIHPNAVVEQPSAVPQPSSVDHLVHGMLADNPGARVGAACGRVCSRASSTPPHTVTGTTWSEPTNTGLQAPATRSSTTKTRSGTRTVIGGAVCAPKQTPLQRGWERCRRVPRTPSEKRRRPFMSTLSYVNGQPDVREGG